MAESSQKRIADALASGPDALLVSVDGLAAISGRTIEPRLYVCLAVADKPNFLVGVSAAASARLSGVALLRCEGGADAQRLSARLAVQEARAGLTEGVLRIIAFAAETPDAVLDLPTYRGASGRLEALVASHAPLATALRCSSIRAQRRLQGPIRLARELTLIAARASGMMALDGPFADVDDLDGLRAEAVAARADGFNGKVAIDPKQIRIIKEIFS